MGIARSLLPSFPPLQGEMTMLHQPTRARAYTLIELLVVVAIIAILIGLSLPAIQKVREAAARLKCQNNLKQIGLALHTHHDAHEKFPTGLNDQPPYANWSWMAMLLPFYEQENLFRAADAWAHGTTYPDQKNVWGSAITPANPAMGTRMPLFNCPSDARQERLVPAAQWGLHPTSKFAPSGYLGVSGIARFDAVTAAQLGIFFRTSATRVTDISDGTSNTLMVGERPPSANQYYGWWFAGAGSDFHGTGDVLLGVREINYAVGVGCPLSKVGLQPGKVNDNCDQAHFWSLHAGGCNFLSADGSVRLLSYEANAILPELSTRAGGEVVTIN
jgi:prepilin-type N-terminal cleavage/methylation domain-containing protein